MRTARFVGLAAVLLLTARVEAEDRLSLDGAWEFRRTNTETWHPATVPGSVHTDLMELGMLADPYYGDNEKQMQWVGEKDWEYRRQFDVDARMLAETHVELVMEGIDTYADVYLNGIRVMRCDNMFRTWRSDVKPLLRKGRNELLIRFESVFRVDMPKYLDAPFRRMAWPNNDQSDIWLSPYARKAGYHYGWDWGPRLITAGIWRSIGLEAWSGWRIVGTHIKTRSLPTARSGFAEMQADCTVAADAETTAEATLYCNDVRTASAVVRLTKGENRFSVPFRVKNPRLWWCNGAGEPCLYDFRLQIDADGASRTDSVRTGIRTVEIVREPDAAGRSMYVRLNGRPIFMKGANYIPMDNFPTRVSDRAYEHLVRSAARCNMNMLRVWGGGIYENDVFYELCDRCGLLVWQDMMFACGMFPADERYLQSVAAEVRDNVRRLRNHPSIALWNGNNENEISYFEWGWNRTLTPEQDSLYRTELHELFYRTVPEAIAAEDDTRSYHPTSPVTGYNGADYGQGDVHFWSVWKGGWIEEYKKSENIGRFMSEYGFQSYPSLRTLRRFVPEDKRFIGSDVLLSHQRARDDTTRDPHFGDNQMRKYLQRYFVVPDTFEDFVYASRLMQAEAVKTGIEAHRRAKPYCMGTLYWQLNDCWPAASWSSIDYSGDWKPLQYYAARAFAEVLVSPVAEDDEMIVYVVSDRREAFDAMLCIESFTPTGELLIRRHLPVHIGADGVTEAARLPLAECGAGNPVWIGLETEAGILCENNCFPGCLNSFSYADIRPDVAVARCADGLLLTLSSSVPIRGLWLEMDDAATVFADNALTLFPGHAYPVKVLTSLSESEFLARLQIRSVNGLCNKYNKR